MTTQSAWEAAFTVLLNKSGFKSLLSDFRDITKLSTIPKLFESIHVPVCPSRALKLCQNSLLAE